MRLHIGFVTAGLRVNPQTYGQEALGGSETALICMARALAFLGQDVTVFCVLEGFSGQLDPIYGPGANAGMGKLQYFDIAEFESRILTMDFDAMIVSRHVGYAARPIKAGTIWYWAHDIAPQSGFDCVAWPLERMLFLSNYHRGLYEAVLHKGFHPFMRVTRNGIEVKRINHAIKTLEMVMANSPITTPPAVHCIMRNRRFCYTSRPERGLMFLLGSIWPRIRQQIPDAELHLAFYEVKNMAIPDDVQRDIDFCMKLIKETAHLGVTYHGALPKDQLYTLIGSCNALLYPCTFPESSCITAIEAMALGTFPITTNSYALPETVGEYGWLIDGKPGTDEYDNAFIDAALAAYDKFDDLDQQNWRFEMSAFTRMHHDWVNIAREWLIDLEEFFRRRFSENYGRVLHKLLYHSDITTVRDYCDTFGAPDVDLAHDGAMYRKKAQAILDHSQDDKEDYSHHMDHMHWRENGRFLMAIAQMKPVLDQVADGGLVLDVGCGAGDFLACLHVQYPQLRLVGVDFSNDCIAEAKAFIYKQGLDMTKFDFHVRTVEEPWPTECFDAVFAGEVLEHVEDTQTMLDKIESTVKDGGVVCITVPSGPWSQIAFRKEGPGIERHIHHFTLRDLQAILGGRGTTMTVDYINAGLTDRGEPIGNFIVSWKVPAGRPPFGKPDLQRKVLTTRPYQSLSGCMIVRNEENTILRCLKSITNICDEIIIGDTGSTDTTKILIESFAARTKANIRVIDVPHDIDGDGLGNFSAWRNAVLAHAAGDWIVSVDADEVMANGMALRRFLETPSLNAYAIAQINMSPDRGTDTHQPQRLYRNYRGYQYKGVIHEHLHTAEEGFQFVEPFLILSDVTLPHDGYVLEHVRYDKTARRNLPMLKKDRALYPDRIYGLVLEMRDVLNICRWAKGKFGGLRPEDVQALRGLIMVYEKHFADPGNFFYADATRYQQDALAILALMNILPHGQRHLPLNAQIQVAVQQGPLMQAAIDQTPPTRRWFKNVGELRKFLMQQADLMERSMPAPLPTEAETPASLLDNVSVP